MYVQWGGVPILTSDAQTAPISISILEFCSSNIMTHVITLLVVML